MAKKLLLLICSLLIIGCSNGPEVADTPASTPSITTAPESATTAVDEFTVEDQYMNALEEAGLSEEFIARRQALVNAETICESIDYGGSAQGTESDKIGVQYFCPAYLSSFSVLKTISVSGSLTINDRSYGTSPSGTCIGLGGYTDINASTQVVVNSSNGEELARTSLNRGTLLLEIDHGENVGVGCELTFELTEIPEGAENDLYIVEIGSRGETSYSFSDLEENGVHLFLG
jgi:hypothetical protein